MTYCLGIKVEDGLVCLADGRVTSGTQVTAVQKVTLHGPAKDQQFCIMTSGLRSVRDKVHAYFERARRKRSEPLESLLDAIETYTRCQRQAENEDREAIEESRLTFNLHTIIAGQLSEDPEPGMFMVYPEGNWVEVDLRTPYLSIGATAYGKPILDRALTYQTDLATALKLAYLSFDSTRFSSADVGYPLDMLTYEKASRTWRQAHYDYDDLSAQRNWWNQHITKLAHQMPDGPWVDELLPESDRSRLSLVGKDPA